MLYAEWKKKQQEEFNGLPIFWAFSNEQFRKAMEERGLTENDTDKIYSLGGGGFYLRTDAEKVRAYFSKPDELPELMESDAEFCEDAFYYELCNHEYAINRYQGDWDVCSCFSSVVRADYLVTVMKAVPGAKFYMTKTVLMPIYGIDEDGNEAALCPLRQKEPMPRTEV